MGVGKKEILKLLMIILIMIMSVSAAYAFTGNFSLNPPSSAEVSSATTTDFNIDTTSENPLYLVADLDYVQHIILEASTGVTGTMSITEYPTSSADDVAFSIRVQSNIQDALEDFLIYVIGPDNPTLTVNQTYENESELIEAVQVTETNFDDFYEYFDIDSFIASADETYSEDTVNDNIEVRGVLVIINSIVRGNVEVEGSLLIINSTISGNVEISDGTLIIDNSRINGNIEAEDCDVSVRDSSINGNIELNGDGSSTFIIIGNRINGNLEADGGFLVESDNNINGNIEGSYTETGLWYFGSVDLAPERTVLFVQITQNTTGEDEITVYVEVTNVGNVTAIDPQITIHDVPEDWNVSEITIDLDDISSMETEYAQYVIQKGPTDSDVYVTAIADNADETSSNIIYVPVFWVTLSAIIVAMVGIAYFKIKKKY